MLGIRGLRLRGLMSRGEGKRWWGDESLGL